MVLMQLDFDQTDGKYIYIFSYQKNTQYTVPVYTGMIKEKLKSFQDFVIRIKYLQKLYDNLVIPFETSQIT